MQQVAAQMQAMQPALGLPPADTAPTPGAQAPSGGRQRWRCCAVGGGAELAGEPAPPAELAGGAATPSDELAVATAAACSDQFAQGRADEALAAGTRLRVSPHGEGVYERFEEAWVGANNHYIRFDSGGAKTVALKKLRPQDWAVLALAAEQEAEIVQKFPLLERRKHWTRKQQERERVAEAAGTKVSLPASATACAASIFPT
jgi:hypothetical protein